MTFLVLQICYNENINCQKLKMGGPVQKLFIIIEFILLQPSELFYMVQCCLNHTNLTS